MMKSKFFAISVFVITGAAVWLASAQQGNGAIRAPQPLNPVVINSHLPARANEKPVIEVVFVLDTTGSMGGLIQAAKDKIWSIASTMALAQPAPEIKMGLVAYRDRGDDYVTRVLDLSNDLDSMYAALMEFQADGGGDGPESVNQALFDAVHNISWSQDESVYQVVFLVGDAPPHMDYKDEILYPVTLAKAQEKGIVVNTIQCGQSPHTANQWRQMARLGMGRFFQVEQNGGAIAVSSPFDDAIARLSAELDKTRMYFGSEQERAKKAEKVAATEKLHASSSSDVLARRAAFNLSKSGKANLLGEDELVDAVSSGRIELKELAEEDLPASLQVMEPEKRQELVQQQAQKRDAIKQRLGDLMRQRSSYVEEQVAALPAAKASFEHKVYEAVREQAVVKGLDYADEEPDY